MKIQQYKGILMKKLLLPLLLLALQGCASFAPPAEETIQSVTFGSWSGGSDDHALIIRRDLRTATSEQKIGTVTQAQFDTLVKELEAANYTQKRHVFTLRVASQGAGSSDIVIETDKRTYGFHSNNTTRTFPSEIDKIHAKWINAETGADMKNPKGKDAGEISDDQKATGFLIGEWRAGIRFLSDQGTIGELLGGRFPRLKAHAFNLNDVGDIAKVLADAGYTVKTDVKVMPIRCLGIWENGHVYSYGENFKIGCKVHGKAFDVNTEFSAEVMSIHTSDKLPPYEQDSFELLNASELNKQGVEAFYADRSIPPYPK